MPTRDQRNQSTRPLQRDMAIDPDRRRSSEPLRYLQRPMAPPPHHFTREGYTGEYSRAGRYQQTESPMQQYSDHPWRYGHAGSTSLDADLDRARRWDMAYAAPRGTAQQHRGLQRDMPWSSRDRIHHVEPGLHPSQRQYTGAGDHVRLPGTTRSLEEPIYRPDKYEPRMESPYGKRRDSATSFFSEVFTEVGYDRGHSPTAINDSSSSDTRPDTGGQP
jgi:hypothetical protein